MVQKNYYTIGVNSSNFTIRKLIENRGVVLSKQKAHELHDYYDKKMFATTPGTTKYNYYRGCAMANGNFAYTGKLLKVK